MSEYHNQELTAQDVANYFLVLVDRDAGDTITQLKLQKLVYFAQGISLALLNKPLFKNNIEAWEHGPVVRELRKVFGAFGGHILQSPLEIDFDTYSHQQKALIYRVYSEYGEYSASTLRKKTHEHSIWQEAFICPDKIISQDKIKSFFKSIINTNFLEMSDDDIEAIEDIEDYYIACERLENPGKLWSQEEIEEAIDLGD